jgi:hypothetical protein
MSITNDLIEHYREVRERLRHPPNAVPDTGINLRRKSETSPEPKRLLPPPPEPEVPSVPSFTPFVTTGLTFSSTLEITAGEFGITSEDIQQRCRKKSVCFPRQVAVYVALRQNRWTGSWVAKRLKLDHTTILHSAKKIATLVEANPDLKAKVQSIEAAVAALNPPTISDLSQQHLEEKFEGNVPKCPVLEMDRSG